MQQVASRWRWFAQQPRPLQVGLLAAAGLVIAGIGSILLPVVPIVLGVALLIAVAIHIGVPEWRPYTHKLLRAPTGPIGRLDYHLPVAVVAGVLLLASGAAGATLRGKLFSEWEQRSQKDEANAAWVDEQLSRARESIARGNVDGAEYFLMSIDPVSAADAGRTGEIEDLLTRLHRCGDRDAILEILASLTPDELAALKSRTTIPKAFDFGEPALNFRAVDIAFTLLDER